MSTAVGRRAPARFVEWAVASRTLEGESESGDLHLVRPFSGGVLLAAVDGLGHGEEAAVAALRAIACLEVHAHESLESLVRRCHADLASTRGVVMSLASFVPRDATLTWMGVGNVEGVLVREEQPATASHVLLLRGGIVGQQLPALLPSVVLVEAGDTLVFATDGIRRDFAVQVTPRLPPQLLADRILARAGKRTDDALALVARFVAEAP